MVEQLDQNGRYVIISFIYLKYKVKIVLVNYEEQIVIHLNKEIIERNKQIFHGQYNGLVIKGSSLESLIKQQGVFEAKVKIVKYLSLKDYSIEALKKKITATKKFQDNPYIEIAIAELVKEKVIDEERRIKEIIAYVTKTRYWGIDRVRFYLVDKLLYPEELVNNCLKELPKDYFNKVADQIAERFAKMSPKNTVEAKIAVKRRLVNRGFTEESAEMAIIGIKKDDNKTLLEDLRKLKRKFQNVRGPKAYYNKIVNNLLRKGYTFSKIDAVFPKESRFND